MSTATVETGLSGTVVFEGTKRRWFPSHMMWVCAGHLAAMTAKGWPHREFRNASEDAVDAWRPDGWTADKEAAFKSQELACPS